LVNRYSTSQQIATRARIILLADDGQNHRQIARSWTSAEIWLALGVTDGWSCKSESCHHLKDCRMQSGGAPATFSMEWLNCLRLPVLSPVITDELSAIGQKENWRMRWSSSASWRVSPHVGRLLQEAQLKPHQIRYWLTPRTKNLTPK